MALQENYVKIEMAINLLNQITINEGIPQTNQATVNEIQNLKKFIDLLRTFQSGLEDQLTEIQRDYISLYDYFDKNIVVPLQYAVSFKAVQKRTISTLKQIYKYLGNYVKIYEKPEEVIRIHIPSDFSLDEYISSLEKIKRAFHEIQKATDINTEVKVNSAEPGSIEIFILLDPNFLITLGGILYLVIKWRKEKRAQEVHLAQMRRYELETKIIEEYSEKFLGMQETILGKLCTKFLETIGKNKPEQLESLKRAIKDFDEIINKKIRLFPLVQSNNSIVDKFPPIETYEKPELLEEQKLIEDKSSE